MRHAKIDLDLAQLFSLAWGEEFKGLHPTDRLPAVIRRIRHSLMNDSAIKGLERRSRPLVDNDIARRRLLLVTRGETRGVIERIAANRGVSYDEVIADCRIKRVSQARHEVIWGLHRGLGISKAESARIVGGRDHTCAIWSVKLVDRLVKKDPSLGVIIKRLAIGEEPATSVERKAA